MPVKRRVFVVPHTHWDREWYRPYQEFRLALLGVMDGWLDALATGRTPALAPAMLDGQTILLDDYLELRPERAEELCRHVAAGRLLVGPWYVQADEFLASGEALVRNLQRGQREAARFGASMAVGYLADQFGHIGQMPQLLRGFGIDVAAFWRGRARDAGHSEFWWQAPDGSRVLALHLVNSYSNAAFLPLDPVALARRIRDICTMLDQSATSPARLLMNGMDHYPYQVDLAAALDAAAPLLAADCTVEIGSLAGYAAAVISSNASLESSGSVEQGEMRSPRSMPLLPGVLSTRMPLKQRNASLQTLLERQAEPWAALASLLPAPTGNASAAAAPYPHAALDLAWTYLLQNHPHDSICGCSIDQVAREMMTRFDWGEQIAGQVMAGALSSLATTMDTRRPWSEPDQAAVQEHIWHHDSAAMDEAGTWRPTTATAPSDLALVTFNAADIARTERARLTLTLPGGGTDYEVVDADGQPVSHRWLGAHGEPTTIMEVPVTDVPDAESVLAQMPGDRVMDLGVHDLRVGIAGDAIIVDVTLGEQSVLTRAEIAEAIRYVERRIVETKPARVVARIHRSTRLELEYLARDVPPHGYRTVWLRERRQPDGPDHAGQDGPSPRQSPADAAPMSISTDLFTIEIDADDGTLTIADIRDGAVYTGCNAFVDDGDAGDTYTYSPPPRDAIARQLAQPPHVTIEDDPLGATARIDLEYRVPAALAESRARRSPTMVTLPITTTVQLTHGVPRIDVTTTVDNAARDHRLRVCFTTPFAADHVHAEGAFDIVRRDIAVPSDTAGWAEQPAPTAPQQGFLAVHGRPTPAQQQDSAPPSAQKRALLVVNRGLPEYEARPAATAGHTDVLLTLLRCVGWLSRDDLSTRTGHAGPGLPVPDAQCPGRHTATYALLPHSGDWHAAIPAARAAASDLASIAVACAPGNGLPATGTFLQVTPPDIAVTALKAAADGRGLILRMVNLAAHPVDTAITVSLAAVRLTRAMRTTLAEEDGAPLQVRSSTDSERSFTITVQPCEIITIRLAGV